MKKTIISIVSALSMSCILFGCASSSKYPASKVAVDPLPAQVSMSDLTASQDVTIEYRSNDPEQIAMITGNFSDINVQNEKDAARVIASLANVLGIRDVSKEILFVDRQDLKGQPLTAYTFRQFYENVPVMSEVLKLMVDQSGTPTLLMNGYHVMDKFDTAPAVDRKAIKKLVKDEYGGSVDGEPELGISFAYKGGQPALVWYAEIKDSMVSYVYANAADGEVLYSDGPHDD